MNRCECAEAKALADTALSFLFRNDGVGYGEALRYHLAFARGWRSRTRLVSHSVFVPEEQDWEMVCLPRPLRIAYYAIRAVRFMLERLSAAVSRNRQESGDGWRCLIARWAEPDGCG